MNNKDREIDWKSILPKKIQFTSGDLVTQEMRTAALLRNETIDDCLSALKDAENRGEICKPLSVRVLTKIIAKEYIESSNRNSSDWVVDMAEAIHRAMTNKEGI